LLKYKAVLGKLAGRIGTLSGPDLARDPDFGDRCSGAVFFNRDSAEPQGSASSCQEFRRNRPNASGTKFATTVLHCCRNINIWIIA